MDEVQAKRIAGELKNHKVGGWTIGDFLGNGKSALVLQAQKDGVDAALKIFDRELIEQSTETTQLERIKREVGLKDHDHPNLVRIFTGGQCSETNHLFVVMELITDPVLSTVIKSLPRESIRIIISQLASAAQYLEETHRLCHRDIKPENCTVTEDGKHAKLLDLGVLRPIDGSDLTDEQERMFIGTHRYSSPEYMLREEEDSPDGLRALTFYQLGGILHDLIMRRILFHDVKSLRAQLVLAVNDRIPNVDADDVDRDLVLLARNCLVKDPKARLRLVRWDDFQQPRTAPERNEQVRQRIRERRSQYRRTGGGSTQRSAFNFENTTKEVHTLVQTVCASLEELPPASVSQSSESKENQALFDLILDSKSDGILTQDLVVRFSLSCVSEDAGLVEIMVNPTLNPGQSVEPNGEWITVFRGAYSAKDFRAALEPLLFEILDQAQSQCESGQTCEDRPTPIKLG